MQYQPSRPQPLKAIAKGDIVLSSGKCAITGESVKREWWRVTSVPFTGGIKCISLADGVECTLFFEEIQMKLIA